jgi:hypothetical protein
LPVVSEAKYALDYATAEHRHADLIRIRKNGKKTEAEVGLPDGESPVVVLLEGMSDEAWLALLDVELAADARNHVARRDGR